MKNFKRIILRNDQKTKTSFFSTLIVYVGCIIGAVFAANLMTKRVLLAPESHFVVSESEEAQQEMLNESDPQQKVCSENDVRQVPRASQQATSTENNVQQEESDEESDFEIGVQKMQLSLFPKFADIPIASFNVDRFDFANNILRKLPVDLQNRYRSTLKDASFIERINQLENEYQMLSNLQQKRLKEEYLYLFYCTKNAHYCYWKSHTNNMNNIDQYDYWCQELNSTYESIIPLFEEMLLYLPRDTKLNLENLQLMYAHTIMNNALMIYDQYKASQNEQSTQAVLEQPQNSAIARNEQTSQSWRSRIKKTIFAGITAGVSVLIGYRFFFF